jgi:hypothetical protein
MNEGSTLAKDLATLVEALRGKAAKEGGAEAGQAEPQTEAAEAKPEEKPVSAEAASAPVSETVETETTPHVETPGRTEIKPA